MRYMAKHVYTNNLPLLSIPYHSETMVLPLTFAATTVSTLLGRLSIKYWSLSVGNWAKLAKTT